MEFRLLRQLEIDRRERSVRLAGMHADEPRALRGADPEAGVAHAERVEDMALQVAVEPLAARFLHHLAGPVDVDAVLPALARIEDERHRERVVLAGDDPRQVRALLVAVRVRIPDA